MENEQAVAGLTIRDYFAGQALAGMMSHEDYHMSYHEVAKEAYRLADAMLKAREVPDA